LSVIKTKKSEKKKKKTEHRRTWLASI